MGSQHCIAGDEELYTHFKIPIIFCHWLYENYKKRKKVDKAVHAVSNN